MARRGKGSVMMPRSNRKKVAPSRDPLSGGPTSNAKNISKRIEPSPEKNSQRKKSPKRSSPLKPPQQSAFKSLKSPPKLKPFPPSSQLQKNSKKSKPIDGLLSSPSKSTPKSLAKKCESPQRVKNSASSLDPTTVIKDSFQTPSPARPSPLKKRTLSNGVDNSEIIESLREKFQQLNMLRTTAAEALLQEYKKNAEERIVAAERLIESVKRENEALKKKLSECNNSNSLDSQSRRVSDVSTLTVDRMDTLRPVIDLYRQLSGLQISADIDAGEASPKWHCLLAGRQGEFSFDLTLEEADSQYRYKPTFSEKSQIASRLPAYLMEEITFDCDQIQLFFWRALNFLMNTTSAGAK